MKSVTGFLLGVLIVCMSFCFFGCGILMSIPEGPDPKTGKIVGCAGCAVRPEFLLGAAPLVFFIGLIVIVVVALLHKPKR